MTARAHDDDGLLAEQVAYYRAVAGEYGDHRIDEPGGGDLGEIVERWAPGGDVLELACGPGTWTARLLTRAATLTAVDAAPEMLAQARRVVHDDLHRVRLVQADLFEWTPDRRYDGVVMGFWLSHVPRHRFADFWGRIESALRPGGTVLFVDDRHRTDAELVEGRESDVVERRLNDGTTHRVVKVPYPPEEIQRELTARGWSITVRTSGGPFYWGHGTWAADTASDGWRSGPGA